MKKCFPTILPAQEMLLPSNTRIDPQTKQRYYKFLSEHVNGFEIHNNDSDMMSSVSTAVNWLISQTRDTTNFPLINEENINFGFSYNLLGLKNQGIIISILGTIFNVTLLFLHYSRGISTFNPELLITGLVINILFLLLWIFIINKNLVKSSGKKYARALLAACDSPFLN